jgi:Skp family chaperone for outer membrane proteins
VLKFVLTSLEGLDEATAKLYKKDDDGKYYLQVEGAVAKSRLDEFREKNIELSRKLETFKDVDPAEYEKFKTKVTELEAQLAKKGDQLSEEDIKKLLSDRTKTMRDDYDRQLGEKDTAIAGLNGKLENLVVDGAIRAAALSGDIAKTAVEDVVSRGRSVFKLKDGVAVPMDSKGQTIYGKNGADPMTPGEWIKGLKTEAPHLFTQPKGGGANGGGGPGGRGDKANMSTLQKLQAGLADRAAS